MKKILFIFVAFVFSVLFVYVVASWDKLFLSSEDVSQVEVVINSLEGAEDLAPNTEVHPEYLSFTDDMMTYYYSLLAKRLTKSGSGYWFEDDYENKEFLKAIDKFLKSEYNKKFNQYSNKELNRLIHKYEEDICSYVDDCDQPDQFKFDLESKRRSAYENEEFEISPGVTVNRHYLDIQGIDPDIYELPSAN